MIHDLRALSNSCRSFLNPNEDRSILIQSSYGDTAVPEITHLTIDIFLLCCRLSRMIASNRNAPLAVICQ